MRLVPPSAVLAVFALLLAAPPALPWLLPAAWGQAANGSTPSSEAARVAEGRAAWQAAIAAAVRGPSTTKLRDQAELALPQGYFFVPQAEATRLAHAMGNQPGPEMVGIITTLNSADQWTVFIAWSADGYVRDNEASELDADALLESLREGTAESNKDRVARGFPALEVTGWLQPPRYDKERHQLTWSLGARAQWENGTRSSVNFNTRALGREGFFSLNLVTVRDMFAQDRGVADGLLSGLSYVPGKRYADFSASTDRVAEYGLVALIGAVAAKKLGLLALIGVAAVKFAKVGVLSLAGIGLALRRFFRRTPKA